LRNGCRLTRAANFNWWFNPLIRRCPTARLWEAWPATFEFVHHDLGWVASDRTRVNRAVFDALKPGGYTIVADHSRRPCAGIREPKSLHRVEESLVRSEVEAVGFKLVAEGQFLRNPADPLDKSVLKPAQPNNDFVLKWQKPLAGASGGSGY
jgi:predicted methyltransferase